MGNVPHARCDGCGQMTRGYLPEGWFKVEHKVAAEPYRQDDYHFCGVECLRSAVDQSSVMPGRVFADGLLLGQQGKAT